MSTAWISANSVPSIYSSKKHAVHTDNEFANFISEAGALLIPSFQFYGFYFLFPHLSFSFPQGGVPHLIFSI
jgi:hypothetical protein